MSLNEEIVQPAYHTQIAFERCCLRTGIAVYRIAARFGRDPMTVSRIYNRWVPDSNTERRAGSQRPPITSSQEDRHVTRMTLMHRAAKSRAPSQEIGQDI
ncbi:HTH_Tnp_Tc3_2 domain-containing protein [Trichonephila clavipes]|uniref:HTH_Tnp_Tc3_2 domain-containing protein n=1 Tax=Trichonephila clavipes TaxID=2585209 RepID=A0A8X6RT97_TRICX|nr:HTH_Tnp_Tc3_2 domain-containing protein [Trichonephila clavipes]